MCPSATYEEGSEILLDQEAVALAAGWADNPAEGSDVFRQGPMVNLSVRAKNVAKAAALICTLPPPFRPPVAVINETKTVEVKANGEVLSLDGAVSLEASTLRVYEITYRAAGTSP